MNEAAFASCILGDATAATLRPDQEDVSYIVLTGLPPGHDPARSYPLLLVLDANLCFGTAYEAASVAAITGAMPPMIVVGVGTAGGVVAHRLRRLRDYLAAPISPATSAAAPAVRTLLESQGIDPDAHMGGADRFLAFLQDRVLPHLASRFAFDPDVGLAGHSAGGAFTCYALLRKATPFTRFILGSFGPTWIGPSLAALEAAWSAEPPAARAFHAIGGAERALPLLGDELAAGGELLRRLGAVPDGLTVESRIFPDETHSSVLSHLLSSGIRSLWSSPSRPAGR